MMNKKITIYSDTIETSALAQFYAAMELPCVVQGALMPDAHTGYTLPIGAVVKTKDKIFPSFVGYDIGCGVSAIKTNVQNLTEDDLQLLKALILKRIPIGKALRKDKVSLKYKYTTTSEVAEKAFKNLAELQVGTLGSGNHFIEVGTDNKGYVNIIVHSGSRGIGATIAEHYMKLAAVKNIDKSIFKAEFRAKNTWEAYNPENYKKHMKKYVDKKAEARAVDLEGLYGFDISSKLGKAYINDMKQAIQFAYENRELIINLVVDCLKIVLNTNTIDTTRFINKSHNYAEISSLGEVLHRKGAIEAKVNDLAVIPGNMRDGSFIVLGKNNLDSMSSCSHGAGRVLSRKKAKYLFTLENIQKSMQGIVSNYTEETIDESPNAYKNIFEVMDLQSDLVEIVDYVKPILNIKG